MSNHSTNVETNVVQMRFDNKNFEKNVKETMDSVDKLKKELKLEESAKSFKQIEENAKKVDFSHMQQGLEKIKMSFSFLDTFSATVYHRLSNRLIDIGKKITKSASTEGIKSGWSEYELKMNSFKTIQASAGKDFTDSQINEYLEELNKYADRTIYSFSDMTNNIGKFTNAGVKLDTAVKAIKGISNEAAVSGANAQEASRAMYNFSQALSAGYVKLIDWKSIENANMATKEFKEELIKTAVATGKLTKATNGLYKTQKGKLINATQNFNDSLADQWMTTEVLTKTLEKYADETTEIGKKAYEAAQKVNTFSKLIDTLKESIQSGWSQTWELLIGNLKEATELWTLVSNKIGKVIDSFFAEKKAIIESWKAHGGRNRMLKAMAEILNNIGLILKKIRQAWRDVFPKTTANTLMSLTESFEKFAIKTKISSNSLETVRKTFKGLFSIIVIVKEAIGAFNKTFGKFFLKVLSDVLHKLFGVTGSLGDMLDSVRKNIQENRTFVKVFESIVKVLDWIYGGIKKVADVLWDFAVTVKETLTSFGGFDAFKKWASNFADSIKRFDITGIAKSIWSMFKTIGKTIDKAISSTFDFYNPMKEKIVEIYNKIKNSKVIQWVINIFDSMVSGIQNAFDSLKDVKTDGADAVVDSTKNKFSVLDKIINFFKKAWEVIKNIAKSVWPVIKQLFSSIGTGIQMLWDGITTNIRNSNLGDAGGFMAGAGLAALFVGIKGFIDNMKPLFKAASVFGKGKFLTNIFKILENASKFIKAKILKEIAVSILMLVGALFVLCTLPQEKIVSATASMGILFQGITSVFNSIDAQTGSSGVDSKTITARLFGIAAMIIAISAAMVVLTIAMKKISKMDTEAITKGTIAIGILFQIISSTINNILKMGQRLRGSKTGDINIAVTGVAGMIKALGKAVIYIMIAVWILAKVIDKYGTGTAVKAIVGIGVLLTIVGKIMQTIMKYTKQSESFSTAISGFATIMALGYVIKQFAVSLVIVIGAIAVVAALVSHNKINGGGLALSLLMLLGVLSMIVLTITSMVSLGKSLDATNGKTGVLKVSALVGVITLFINALSVLFIVLSLIPNDWATSGVMALSTIAGAMSVILLAISKLLKNSFFDTKNAYGPKGIAVVLGAITLSIVSLVTAVTAMANMLKGGGSIKAILILGGIATAIAGIIIAIGHFEKVATGFTIFTKGLAAFGIAAAGFATAALLIIVTLKEISKMSDSEIAKIGTNMKKVATSILSASDQLIGIIVGLIRIIVSTVIHTTLTVILDSAGTIIEGLIKLCDVLLVKSPVLISKILQVLVQILSQLEREMGPLVAQVVSFTATFISDVAQAIKDNAPKIAKAINDVFDAIATVVAQSIAKIFGFDKFKGAVNTLKNLLKPVTALLVGLFAYKKVKTGALGVIKLIDKIKLKLITFKGTLKTNGFGTAWREFLGVDKAVESWQRVVEAHKRGMASTGTIVKNGLKSIGNLALIGAEIGLVVGTIANAFLEAKIEAIDATSSIYEDADKEFTKLENTILEHNKSIRNKIKESRKEAQNVDSKYASADQMKKRLLEDIDSKTGKIKDGKEEEVKRISEEFEDQLGIRMTLEDGILKLIDAQGKARQFDLEMLEKEIKLEQFKEKLQKQKERRSDLEEELKTAKKEKEKLDEKYDPEVEKIYEKLRKISNKNEEILKKRNKNEITEEQKNELLMPLNKEYEDLIDDIMEHSSGYFKNRENVNAKDALDFYRQKYTDTTLARQKAEENIKSLTTQLQNIDDAQIAYEQGKIDEMEMYSLVFSGYYKTGLSDKQKQSELDRLMSDTVKAIDNVEESIYSEVKGWIDSMKLYKQQLGQDTSDLDRMWNEYEKKYNEKRGKPETTTTTNKTGSSKSGINGVVDKAKSFAKSTKLGDQWDDYAKTVTKNSEETGKNQAKGQLNGYADAILGQYGKNKLDEVADGLESTIDVKWGIESPSKVMRDEVGVYLGQGMMVGMEEGIKNWDLSNMSTMLIDRLRTTVLPGIASLTGNSSPFGGMTPVNFGLNQNGSGFSPMPNFPLAQSGVLPYATHLDNINNSLNRLTERMVQQTDGIISEIQMLRGDISDLGTRVSGLEVRIDGRALVGEIAPMMNDELINHGIRVGRGV